VERSPILIFSKLYGGSHGVSKSVPFVGMVVSGIVGILFLADLAVAIPFSRVSVLADVGFILSSGILAYLSWSTLMSRKEE
jgi:predicted exporter